MFARMVGEVGGLPVLRRGPSSEVFWEAVRNAAVHWLTADSHGAALPWEASVCHQVAMQCYEDPCSFDALAWREGRTVRFDAIPLNISPRVPAGLHPMIQERVAVYASPNYTYLILGFRGTADFADVVVDATLVARGEPNEFMRVVEAGVSALADAVRRAPRGANVYVTGHSLGGAYAMRAAIELNNKLRIRPQQLCVFNSAPLARELEAEALRSADVVTHYHVPLDPVSSLALPSATRAFHPPGMGDGPLARHSLSNFERGARDNVWA